MALPSLYSELACLQNWQEILQARFDLEKHYTSSLLAWQNAAHKIIPHHTHALYGVFFSLAEATQNGIQSRQDMEGTFRSQMDAVLAAMKDLTDHCDRISARSEALKEFDGFAGVALENRKLRYKEWTDWKFKPVSPAIKRQLPWSKQRDKSTLVDDYNLADMEVRRCISKAEVARCSFKDKATEEVDAISGAYQVVINTIIKYLRLFAEHHQECASNASNDAARIVKATHDTLGSRVASDFQTILVSEAQDIPTNSVPYIDPERYPTIQSQPIILGCYLPPPLLSCTTGTGIVVDVFCKLVAFIHDHGAWDKYATGPTERNYIQASAFRDFERSWTRNDDNRDLLRGLGESTCADFVKLLLASFPEPLCTQVPIGSLGHLNPGTRDRFHNIWRRPGGQDDAMALIPLVEPLHNRPQGEMVRALCNSLIPVFRGKSKIRYEPISEVFSGLLTRNGGCIKDVFPVLVMEFSTTMTIIDDRNARPRSPQQIFDSPPYTSVSGPPLSPTRALGAITAALPPSFESAAAPPPPAPALTLPLAPLSTPSPSPSSNSASRPRTPQVEADDEDNTPTINDVESLRKGIIKTSRNAVQAQYTILLVGETGVGKSSFLEYIGNVLLGNDIDHLDPEILDRMNEQGGPDNQSQTNSARLYNLTSKNGMVVRILDTPGLADTRGIEQDEIHKKNIATVIQKHIDSVTAVLILANGCAPRLTVGTDYALSTLSSIFPKSLTENISFMFTNVPSPLFSNFDMDTLPEVLRAAEPFLFDNPVAAVAAQKKYNYLRGDLAKKKVKTVMRNAVLASQEKALEELVKLFDWLDCLRPQPTTEIVYLYNISQNIEATITSTFAQMDQAATKKVGVDKLMDAVKNDTTDVNVICNLKNIITVAVWKQQHSPTTNMICGEIDCYSNCDMDCESNIPLDLSGFFGGLCEKCNHNLWNHHRCRATWGQVHNTQVSVDQTMKDWDAAKVGTERTAILTTMREKVLRELNQIINSATTDLAQLMERYSRLSLSGSFVVQVESAVRLLQQHYIAMEKKGVDQDQLQRVKVSLGHMERKLELLNGAKESTRKERVAIR